MWWDRVLPHLRRGSVSETRPFLVASDRGQPLKGSRIRGGETQSVTGDGLPCQETRSLRVTGWR